MLDVGDGNRMYWETCGNLHGKPAVVLHGGPGSGCTPWHRRLFSPAKYRVVLFDQRGCCRSTPHASAPDADLSGNHTWNLVADLERLRKHLKVERWLLLGGSWGCTLALAYAERHPDCVSEMVLWGVTTGRRMEFDWCFRGGASILFPEQWERLRAALPATERDGDIVEAYHRMLSHSDPEVRRKAALAWCTWESTTLDWPSANSLAPRFTDPDYALGFARIVIHYVRNSAWLEDGQLLRDLSRIAAIPATLVSGRMDFQAPVGWAWDLHRAWPRSRLTIVSGAGHSGSETAITRELVCATDQFANP